MADERKGKYINPYTDFGFKKLFEERQDYEESVKIYRDLKNSLDTAVWKANKEIARRMKTKGYAVENIAEITGLTVKEIEGL